VSASEARSRAAHPAGKGGRPGPVLLKRRPLTIEAWQVRADNIDDVAAWSGGVALQPGRGVALFTDTGDLTHAFVGDWVVRGPFDEFYPAVDKTMAANYEAVISVVSE